MGEDENSIAEEVQSRNSNVKRLLSERKNEEAVKASLSNPPVSSKNDSMKILNTQSILAAITACNKGEMQRAIESLTLEEEDTLMKYLTKLLATPSQSSLILDWHTKLSVKAGMGCIMRALTDRKTV
ncbi:hypothetical protein ABG067_000147 [Albugo candida]|uniref:Actin-related protein 2/3 complex subunit 5 n=1 Tax=Albugo candida TaxID=65357 RepID=A0A024GJ81_9STRA|nr:unnamed protein product [Albugo candida]|eukprot:CCI46836.1 unnamed protein product [Albugo candida]